MLSSWGHFYMRLSKSTALVLNEILVKNFFYISSPCLFSVVPIFPCGKRQKCCVTFFHFLFFSGWPLQERTVYPSSHTITWQFEYWWSKLHKCDKANVEKKMMKLLKIEMWKLWRRIRYVNDWGPATDELSILLLWERILVFILCHAISFHIVY